MPLLLFSDSTAERRPSVMILFSKLWKPMNIPKPLLLRIISGNASTSFLTQFSSSFTWIRRL